MEDDDRCRRLISDALRLNAIELRIAASLGEAREFLCGGVSFDLGVFDARLPDGDGLQLVAELRRRRPASRIVMVTAYASLALATLAGRRGADAVLQKPFAVSSLLALVQKHGVKTTHVARSYPRLDWVQRQYIEQVLREHAGNVSATARALGMHRQSLQRILRSQLPLYD